MRGPARMNPLVVLQNLCLDINLQPTQQAMAEEAHALGNVSI